MPDNSREILLEALLQVEENEGYSNLVLDKTLKKYSDLDKRDKALVSIIFYGVLEKKIALDYIISLYLKDKRLKLSRITELILETAVYQIFYLERVPDSAAVNCAVELAKIYKQKFSFINAVLRSIVTNKNSINFPEGDSPFALSIRYSIPEELINLWLLSYGKNITANLLEDFNKKASIFVRRNNTRISHDDFMRIAEENLGLHPVGNYSAAYRISNTGILTQNTFFDEGLYHVQDLSSQLLCDIINPNEGEKVLDVCAAPGGKTFTLAEKMNNKGEIYSFDLYRGRVNLIRKGAERLGLNIVNPRMRDAASDTDFIYEADKVLCDVPCSGFGTIRRKPEIRYKSIKSINSLPEIQYAILLNSKRLVKIGGILIYSTCTLNKAENNAVANRFLFENPDYVPYSINSDESVSITRTIDEPENQLTMMPFSTGTDGFFTAMFKRIR